MATDNAKEDVKSADTAKETPEGRVDNNETLSAEEKAELEAYCSELAARYVQLDALLRDNENPGQATGEHAPFAKTDSTLKRNTAFVKKLKSYTEAQREALMRELPVLNLTKYLEEVANALLEAKLRSSDLPHVLLINCLLHRNYPAYAELALDAWRKCLPTVATAAGAASAGSSGTSSTSTLNLAKLRIDLRLFADLVLTRVVPPTQGFKLLGQCLQFLTAGDTEFNHCGLVCHLLAQCGDSLTGRAPTRKVTLAERCSSSCGTLLPRSPAYLEPEVQRTFHRLLAEYSKRLTAALTGRGAELAQLDRGNRRVLHSKGELSQERREAFEACKKEVDRLMALASQLCNLLGEPAPQLPPIGADDLDEEERAAAEAVSAPAGAGRLPGLDEAAGGGRFEDEEARQFYEMLPDLRPMLPEVVVREARERRELSRKAAGESPQPSASVDNATTASTAEEPASEEALLERELAAEEEAAAAAAAAAASASTTTASSDNAVEQLQEAADTAAASDANLQPPAATTAAAAEPDEAAMPAADVSSSAAAQRLAQLELFLAGLPTLVNRDMIDKAAIQFATALNSKSARRRLAQAMLGVHRSRCDLLPFYARLAAVLAPVAPEVAEELCQRLQRDFKHAYHKKDHTNLETKLKVVRFIGELVKFGLFPLSDAALDLKLLVINFSNHCVELACALLESCGRFMYATQETHLRLKVYLRNLWNKKTKIVTDERLTAMIENAYYAVVPPDNSRLTKVVQLPPVMQFVQRLLFKELCNPNVEKVLRLCLSLPWSDPAVEQFVVRCFSSVWCVPYGAVHCLASVLAGIAPYYQSAAIAVVDNVLEDIRLGMEINAHRLNQRRVACIRYLGEMFNYCLVESGVVFNTLHSLVTLGVCLNPEADTPLDPPEHLLRIRLACLLLETCGQYFDTGSNKRRLDAYLLYLQQYYWYKRKHPVWTSGEERPFPLDIEFLYFETVDALRPKFKHAASFDEARGLVAKQEKAFLAKLERVASKLRPAAAAASSSSATHGEHHHHQHLPTIAESGAAGGAAATAGTTGTDDDDSEDGAEAGIRKAEGDGSTTEDENVDRKRRGGGGGVSASQSDNEAEDSATATAAATTEEEDAEAGGVGGGGRGRTSRAPVGPQLMACPEDDDFLRAFERVLAVETGGVGVGFQAASSASMTEKGDSQLQRQQHQGQPGTVAFTVMTRRSQRGGSQQQQQPVVQLPADSQLARRYLAAAEAEAREREAIKRATLSITAAQMMQEDQEAEYGGGGGGGGMQDHAAAAAEFGGGGGYRRGGGGCWRRPGGGQTSGGRY